jgi:hypothetical protein
MKYIVVQNPLSKLGGCSADQEIPFLRNVRIHHCDRKTFLRDPALSQLNPVITFTPYFFQIELNTRTNLASESW